MATITIPWSTGSGNIVIEYNGEGNGALLVYSDSENTDSEERSQSINVMTTAGAPQVAIPLTVRQGAKENPYLLLESGGKVLLQSGGRIILGGGIEPEPAGLYPMENGVFTFDDGTVLTVTNGNHVRIDFGATTSAEKNVAISHPSYNNGSGTRPSEATTPTWFTIAKGAVSTIVGTNIAGTATGTMQFNFSGDSIPNSYNAGNVVAGAELTKTVTASADTIVDYLRMSIGSAAADTYIEFDVEFTVDGVRYI